MPLVATAAATALTPQQLTVTAANASGDSIYDLTLATGSSGALISGIQALNSDGTKHGSFDALVWSPNAFTGTLDLIVADATKGQILRYAGPNYGTSSVIFTYAGKGSGPAYPAGLAVDGNGNLLVISPSAPLSATPALWVVPFNKVTGVWSAPVLIDDSFSGVRTLALAEVLVAGTAATADGNAAPAWNIGDILVLVGDTFDSRVIVYSKAAIAGVLAKPKVALSGPTSTVVTSREFLSLLAAPFGMDIWPADATHGASLLFTTVDGRIIRFDTRQNSFTGTFASGLGLGLTKLKVGMYAGKPYAFVAQLGLGSNGKILQFGAPPASGANKALASVTQGVSEPIGLALVSAGSTPVSSCVAPSSCSPVGPQLTVQISGPGASRIPAGATILDQACTVPTDPRVQVSGGIWSCLPPGMNVCGTTPTAGCVSPTLDVANYCPGFPSTILPATMCGHAGANGASFQVIKGTAELLDENANDIYIQTTADPTVALPGPFDLGCQNGVGQQNGQVVAFGPRSDLPGIEGTIIEDTAAPFFAEVTSLCDTGAGNSHVASMFAFGLGLNTGLNGLGSGANAGLFGFVTTKFNNLSTMIQEASPQITPLTVTTTLENYVTQSQTYFNSDHNNDVNDYSCALNSIASTDVYLRQQAGGTAFSYTAPALGNNNPNPAGEIDSRLANLYFSISGDFLYAPNPTWPTNNVPPCVTLTITSTGTPAVGGSATLNIGPPTLQSTSTPLYYTPTQCTLSASDGTYATPATVPTSGSVSTGTLTRAGTYTATLECAGTGVGGAADSSSSFATTSVAVSAQPPTLQSITVAPAGAVVPVGSSVQYTATGHYSDSSSQNVSSVVWSAANNGVATISNTGLLTCQQPGTSSAAATIIGGTTTGSVGVTCTAGPTASISVTPTNPSVGVGSTQQFAATGFDAFNNQTTLSSLNWASSNTTVASISGALATCLASGTSTITATSGSITSNGAVLTCGQAVTLTASPTTAAVNTNVALSWAGSAAALAGDVCALTSSDNKVNLTGQGASGSTTATESVAENVTYTITCSGSAPGSASVTVAYTVQTTYQYTGTQFPNGDVFNGYTTADRVIASITVNAALGPNASISTLNPGPTVLPAGYLQVSSDGRQVLAQQSGVAVILTTDGNGNINSWSLLNSSTNADGTGNGVATQNEPAANEGAIDFGYMNLPGTESPCTSNEQCGIISGPATVGTWTSTNAQSMHVMVGTTSGTNPSTGQLFQAILGGTAATPTLSATTILSETPEPSTCFSGGQSVASGAVAGLTSLSFVPNSTTGFSDLVAGNTSSADVFLLSGPSYQPTSDIFNALPACSNTGPGKVAVAGGGAGVMVGTGVTSTASNEQIQGLYYFPPTPTAASDFVFMTDVNADASLTTCNVGTNVGCVNDLADAVVAPAAVAGTSVAGGDMLVLVGDNMIGNGNPVVLRYPAASIAAAKNCATGGATPCFANVNVGGSQLVTQTTLGLASSGATPLSLDISQNGYLFIAMLGGNIYVLSPDTGGYGPAALYATGVSGIQQVRVGYDQVAGQIHVFATGSNGIYEFVGLAPPGGGGASGAFAASSAGVANSGVGFAAVDGTPAGLAVH